MVHLGDSNEYNIKYVKNLEFYEIFVSKIYRFKKCILLQNDGTMKWSPSVIDFRKIF